LLIQLVRRQRNYKRDCRADCELAASRLTTALEDHPLAKQFYLVGDRISVADIAATPYSVLGFDSPVSSGISLVV